MSDKESYEQRLTTAVESEGGESPSEVIPDRIIHIAILYTFSVIAIQIAGYLIYGPVAALVLSLILIVIPFIGTATGRGFWKGVQQKQEDMDVGQSDSSKAHNQKRLCQACGWQNPPENAYCHDCGTELGQSE